MPIESILVLVGVAVLAMFAMGIALGAAWLAGQRRAEALYGAPASGGAGAGTAEVGRASTGIASDGGWALDVASIDRVVRVVALLYIAAVGVVVALSGGETPALEVAVYLLLAGATLFTVFMQDLLPTGLAGRTRFWLEALGAVAFLTVLVGLTGGLSSPFFIGYFLLVGGAALAGEGLGPIALALGSAAAYAVMGLLVGIVDEGFDTLSVQAFAWIGFNVLALLLLAYVGMVAGRAQRRARDAALRLSRFDPLTGLYNRSAFFAGVEREIKRVERTGRGFCVLMLDLDDLKPVNDTFGHPAGDQLLRAITEVVLRTVRATDLAGRYGGDEFVVLLPETDAEGAFVVAEKLRRDISMLAVRVHDRSVRASVSLGLVAFPEDGRTIEELLSAVDAAMYEAKRRGKNQIVGYTTRTERVATAIGPERQAPARPPRPRVDASRSTEIGLMVRPSVREESDQPIGEPPYGEREAPAPPARPAPAARVAPAAVHEEDPLDAAAPAFPAAAAPLPSDGAPVAPEPTAGDALGATGADAGSQPASMAAPTPSMAAPPASAAPSAAGTALHTDPTRPAFRAPAMPSLPAQPLRGRSGAPPSVAPMPSAAPIPPPDAAGARPPVPPAGAPWQTRMSPQGSGPLAPRDPRKPADRQYVAFPIQGQDPDD